MKNRAQRRHERFGAGRSSERGGWPTSRPNPALAPAGTGDAESEAEEVAATEPKAAKARVTKAPQARVTKAPKAGPKTGAKTTASSNSKADAPTGDKG